MLFPRTHTWTPFQRWLVISATVVGIAGFAMLVYGYERYCRGPGQEALFGTWECTDGCLTHMYFRFNPNHNVDAWAAEDGSTYEIHGRWYAGGDFLYLRFIGRDIPQKHPITIWRIDELTTSEMHIRSGDITHTMTRVVVGSLPNASNHALEPTATRRTFTFQMIKTISLEAPLAFGGGSSACSR